MHPGRKEAAADHRAFSAERNGFQHVLSAADAAIHPHLDARADFACDSGSAEIEEGAPSS
jgi:hypothetical protein